MNMRLKIQQDMRISGIRFILAYFQRRGGKKGASWRG